MSGSKDRACALLLRSLLTAQQPADSIAVTQRLPAELCCFQQLIYLSLDLYLQKWVESASLGSLAVDLFARCLRSVQNQSSLAEQLL